MDFYLFSTGTAAEVNQYNGVEVLVYDKSGIKYGNGTRIL